MQAPRRSESRSIEDPEHIEKCAILLSTRALVCKKNEFWLFLMETWGGLAPEGVKLFNLYKERAKAGVDRTEYVVNDVSACTPLHYAPHWAQLLSAAAVIGDAERALAAVDKCRSMCRCATPRRPALHLPPHGAPR